MILALEKQRYHLELKLRTEYGIPGYLLEGKEESQLTFMIDTIPINPWMFYDRDNGFSINLCERLATKFKVNNNIEKCKAYLQYSLDCIADQGHCYGREWQVRSKLNPQNFTDAEIQFAINQLQAKKILYVSDKNNYFLNKYFLEIFGRFTE